MKNYFLIGLFGLIGTFLQAQGFGKMQFTIEGGVSDATGAGIAKSEIQVYILPADTLKLLTDKILILSWLKRQTEPFYVSVTNAEGFFGGEVSRESFQKLRAAGLSLRESMAVIKAQATNY